MGESADAEVEVERMGDNSNVVDEVEEYRWRPAVAPFRPRAATRIRPRKPLPGQTVLPGFEFGDESPPTGEHAGNESHLIDTAKVHRGGFNAGASERAPTCPNCGATEFDEDGDCTNCWEPSVVRDSPE